MTSYLVEFRLGGFAKKYAQGIIAEIVRKFKVKGMQGRVSHITLFGPFTTNNINKVASEIVRISKKYDFVAFKFKNFNCWDSNKVFFIDIEPSEKLKDLRYELSEALRKITKTISSEDRKPKDKFHFHSTVAFKDTHHKFEQIWNCLKNKKQPDINNYLLRVTLLRNSKILYEYDLLQKKLLNRQQALNKHVFRETIKILKDGKDFRKHMDYQEIAQPEIIKEEHITHHKNTLIDRIKHFFGIK